MTTPLRVLLIEDSENDTELLLRELRRGGYAPEYERVETPEGLEDALTRQSWDLILSDYAMPRFNGVQALKLTQAKGGDIPFILVSGAIGEDIAVAAMKAGAHDYLMKGKLARLLPSIARELGEVRVRQGRRQAEEEIRHLNTELSQFKNTLDQTLEAVYIFDPESLRFTYVNEGAKRQTGYSQTELMQMTPVDFNKPVVTLERFKQLVQPLITGVQPSFTFQSVQHHKDGHDTPVEVFLQLIRLEGQAPRFVATVNDISARKQAQEEILQLNAELEERVRQRTAQLQAANQELEAFSYSVSHDLRTPLNTIDGFSKLLGKEIGASAATERGKHYLARVRAGVVQMGELIDALLSLAQVSRTSLRRESVDLSALAETVLNAYREREPGRAAQLAIQPGLVVQGDPGLLRQVLENLLGNAWKYSSKQPQTHIIFRRESGPDGVAVYTVRDHGAGFDMAYSDKLFGVFQRLHTASEFEGTGIGLATVHKIITRHGGRVWAESAPGQGATFYLTLGAGL